jgi:hypothetical protein
MGRGGAEVLMTSEAAQAVIKAYMSKLEAETQAVTGNRRCRCCAYKAQWVHVADGSPWCGALLCQALDGNGALVTKPRDRAVSARIKGY